MKHSSIKIEQPCEFINSEAISPLISKVQIKVCYVSDESNRNKSIITKEVAKEMAPSLRGAPIVAYYNEERIKEKLDWMSPVQFRQKAIAA